MALFFLKAQQGYNKPIKCVIELNSTRELSTSLKEQDFKIITLKKVFWLYALYHRLRTFLILRSSLNIKTQRIFCAEMSSLLKAGLNINDAILQCLSSTHNYKLRVLLLTVYERLKRGESPEEAFSRMPKAFPAILINFLHQSKQTGQLDTAFIQYEKLCAYRQDIHHGITQQILPQIVLVIAMLSFVFLLHKQTAEDFEFNLNRDMPFWTRVFVEGVPWVFSHKLLFTFLGGLGIFLLFKELFRRTSLILWIPFLNKATLLRTRLNFIKILSIGIESKIPVQSCFLTATQSIQHKAFKKWSKNAENSLFAGADFSSVLEKTRLLSPVQKSIIKSNGGSATNLKKSFDAILEFLERDVRTYNKFIVQLWRLLVMLFIFALAGVTFLAFLYPLLGWLK